MARGGFIDHHFSFTGDGRSNGTEQGSSGLGDAQQLALSITANVALQLSKAGWVTSDELFNGDITNKIVSVDGETFYTNNNQDTSYVIEMPMTYGSGESVTKIWLMYCYGGYNGGIAKIDCDTWLAYLGNYNYIWSGAPACPQGISLLYCPPKCSKSNTLRLGSLATAYNNTANLANSNTNNVKYTYHVVTKDNYISINLHLGNKTSSLKTLLEGPIIKEFYDSGDTTCQYKEYGAVSSMLVDYINNGEKEFDPSYKYFLSNNGSDYPYAVQFVYTPGLQYYNIDGDPQCCNATLSVTSSYHNNLGLFECCNNLLKVLNTQSMLQNPRNIYYSKILIGSIPSSNNAYWTYQARVSSNNFVKGIIDSDYLIAVTNSVNATNFGQTFPLGQTFDGGNYVHIGSGICIGWDSTNTLGIIDNSPNTMQTASIVQS